MGPEWYDKAVLVGVGVCTLTLFFCGLKAAK
jgi:hypothetical protein